MKSVTPPPFFVLSSKRVSLKILTCDTFCEKNRTRRSPWLLDIPGWKCAIWCCPHISHKKLHQLTTVASDEICISDLITFCGTLMAHKYMNRINCWGERWLFEKNEPSRTITLLSCTGGISICIRQFHQHVLWVCSVRCHHLITAKVVYTVVDSLLSSSEAHVLQEIWCIHMLYVGW